MSAAQIRTGNLRLKTFFKVYGVLLALSVLRIALSIAVSDWFPSESVLDDGLMMEYASLRRHFLSPDRNSLVKYMAYPIFLNVVRYSHLPYPFFTGLLAVVSAFSFRAMLLSYTGNQKTSAIGFTAALFLPCAFELWCGTRIYRNAILAPCTVIVLSLLFLLVRKLLKNGTAARKCIAPALLLGIAFSFTYYVKEDGIWLLAVLIFTDVAMMAAAVWKTVRKREKAIAKAVVSIAVPLAVFGLVTGGYLAVNHRYFGVYELNTRTSGEAGRFVQTVYKVASDERSDAVWAPNDAIKRVFQASESLAARPEIYERLKENPWSDGDMERNPLKGDYLSWAIRYAVDTPGTEWNEAEVSAFFRQVNEELSDAFRSGELTKDASRIQLLPSAAGKTWGEIADLLKLTGETFRGAVLLAGYTPGVSEAVYEEAFDAYTETAKLFTNLRTLNGNPEGKAIRDAGKAIANVIFWICRIGNAVAFCLAAASVIFSAVRLFAFRKDEKRRMRSGDALYTAFAVFFLLLGAAYGFAISWFSSFLFTAGLNRTILNFYAVSLPAILLFFYGFGGALFMRHLKAMTGGFLLKKAERSGKE